ncbi:MAG: putative transrane protein [Myxococcaceae bacterium]|nr:putative transrane protein [Myxococcaceae bacterium]
MLNLKKVLKCIGAGALLTVGAALLVLPGPGMPMIAAGIAMLASEYEWAQRLEHRTRDFVRSLWLRRAAT